MRRVWGAGGRERGSGEEGGRETEGPTEGGREEREGGRGRGREKGRVRGGGTCRLTVSQFGSRATASTCARRGERGREAAAEGERKRRMRASPSRGGGNRQRE
jgi:hypothetical protein